MADNNHAMTKVFPDKEGTGVAFSGTRMTRSLPSMVAVSMKDTPLKQGGDTQTDELPDCGFKELAGSDFAQ